MLAKKKKLSRKEIKEDKLVATYYKAYGYIDENKQKLAIYGGALILLVVAVIFYMQNKNKNNEEAGTELARVMSLYDAGSYQEAINGRTGTKITGLKKIVENYGSTENGEIAKVYLANSYVMINKNEDAVKYYEDYSGSNKLFKATAVAGEAGYHASKNEYEKAADLYLKASKVSDNNALNPDYILNAGIYYMRAGKNDEAKELFENIRDNYKTSTAYREVNSYLAELE